MRASRRGPAPPRLKIVSGGQTGVDRAALDVALRLGMPCGGWCPRGRRAEDGTIPSRYPLAETPDARYPQRTLWNVRDSDGTLVLHAGRPRGGTALTLRLLGRQHKPALRLDLDEHPDPAELARWIGAQGIRVLNVAGPRESECPGGGPEGWPGSWSRPSVSSLKVMGLTDRMIRRRLASLPDGRIRALASRGQRGATAHGHGTPSPAIDLVPRISCVLGQRGEVPSPRFGWRSR